MIFESLEVGSQKLEAGERPVIRFDPTQSDRVNRSNLDLAAEGKLIAVL